MSARVEWTERALRRVEDIADFLAERSPAAAARAVEQLFDRVGLLEHQPEMGTVFPGSPSPHVRVLYPANYRVYYHYDPASPVVTVLTVRHAREAPLSLEQALDDENP